MVQEMTSIRPPINVPTVPSVSRDTRALVSTSKDSDPQFASLALSSSDLPPDSGWAGSMRTSETAVRSAIAHVFNAYGFFAADRSPTSDQTEFRQTPALASAGAHSGKMQTAAANRESADISGQHLAALDSASAPQASSRASAAHDNAFRAGREPIAKGTTESVRPGDAHLRSIENRLASERQLPDQASAKASPNREVQAEQRDRVTLKIAEHTVELVARLSNLSEEEKERLLGEIDSLLAEHGLSLATATLNGEPLTQALRIDR